MRKKILILGGTSDIGVAIAHRFAEEKFDVCFAGRNLYYLDRIARDIAIRKDVEASYFAFDAQDILSHPKFYSGLSFTPDVSVCAFGYLGDQLKAEENWEETRKIIDINYTGAVSILNIIAHDYSQKQVGTIIGISSVAGDRGRQSNYIYGSAKAGLTIYLAGLRNLLHQRGIHVLTVKPGYVRTRMTDHLKLPDLLTVSPEQVAASVYNAYKKKKNTLYVSKRWRWIMLVIRIIPEFIFKKLRL